MALDVQAGTKETGPVFPQVGFRSQVHAHLLRYNDFPKGEPVLDCYLEKRAKLTDVVSQASISAHGLLMSERTKEILERFHLMQHRFYPAPLTDLKGAVHRYYWLHLADMSLVQRIDYSRSTFFCTEAGFRTNDITLISYEDYLQKKAALDVVYGIEADSIVLNDTFDRRLDLFIIPTFSITVYISEPLAQALTESHITGIDIQEAPVV